MSFDINKNNAKLKKLVKRVEKNKTLSAYWVCSNINSIDRMGIHDHGKTHIYTVANSALKMLELLREKRIYPNVVQDFALNKNIKKYNLDFNDAEVVVFLAACLHDIGIGVHREDHTSSSVLLAPEVLNELLKGMYGEEEKAIMKSEVMHCIFAHHSDNKPLTVEASVVRIADALDMTEGRAKIPFRAGTIDDHNISAMSIKEISLKQGEEKPIDINILMNSSAGIFHVQRLKKKIEGTKLEEQIKINAEIDASDDHKIPKKMSF